MGTGSKIYDILNSNERRRKKRSKVVDNFFQVEPDRVCPKLVLRTEF